MRPTIYPLLALLTMLTLACGQEDTTGRYVSQSSAALSASPTPFVIYTNGALQHAWWDNSSATRTLDATANLDGTLHTISTKMTAWSYVMLYAGTVAPVAGFDTFMVRVNAGTNSNPSLTLRLSVGGSWKTSKLINGYCTGGSLPANTWVECNIPLADLGVTSGSVGGLYLQNNSGTVRTIYFSSMAMGAYSSTPTCTGFTYAVWDDCLPGGTQSRTVVASTPSGCAGGNPVLTQTCTYVPSTCTGFTYSDWGACRSDGTQTRTLVLSSPAGCMGGSPLLSQSCAYAPPPTCTAFTYSDWSVCRIDDSQTRSVLTPSPSGCADGNPVTTQSCTYVSSSGTTTYTSLVQPAKTGLGTPRLEWTTGEKVVVKDNQGAGDLIGFFLGTHLYAATSQDNGVTWAWVTSTGDVATVTSVPHGLSQDVNGKVHVVSSTIYSVTPRYSRLTLTRDGSGHVTAFSADVHDVTLPGTYNAYQEMRCEIVAGSDKAGTGAVFWSCLDSANGTSARLQAGKSLSSAGLAPAVAADFGNLADATGSATQLYSGGSGAYFCTHNRGQHFAQHPISKDLWFEWGAINTGDSANLTTVPVMRVRAAATGSHTWTLGATTTVESKAGNGYAPFLASVTATTRHVWMARFSPARGMVIDAADASGTVTAEALPRAFTDVRTGYYALTVSDDETRAWLGGWISMDSPNGRLSFGAYYFDGTAWKYYPNSPSTVSDTWGVGGVASWSRGLVLVVLDPSTFTPSFATISSQ
jgi:hypothetical protein